jgi:hypothetical protein
MKYLDEKNGDALGQYAGHFATGQPYDYSEEAIPERDPAYRLPDGTDYAEPTVEAVSAEERLDLARCLERLGMSPSRAAIVARL